ncbi:uncharacterized protein [Amphiura filiformis]|uniref:uncharacterized protein isoform X2 n=1 Tax=Amphiura filiformis TaxID=82378 RepID=UPI003B22292F
MMKMPNMNPYPDRPSSVMLPRARVNAPNGSDATESVRSAPAGPSPQRPPWAPQPSRSNQYLVSNQDGRQHQVERPPQRFGRDAPPVNRRERVTSMPPMYERNEGMPPDFGNPFAREQNIPDARRKLPQRPDNHPPPRQRFGRDAFPQTRPDQVRVLPPTEETSRNPYRVDNITDQYF